MEHNWVEGWAGRGDKNQTWPDLGKEGRGALER